MNYFTVALPVVLASLQSVLADTPEFAIVNSNNGGDLQGYQVYLDNGMLKMTTASEEGYESITDAGKLKLSDGTYAVSLTDGSFVTGTESLGTAGWSVQDGKLYFKGSETFYGVRGSGNGTNATYTFATSQGSDGKAVIFDVMSHTSDPIVNFPDNSTSSSNSSSVSSGTYTNSTTGTTSSNSTTSSNATTSASHNSTSSSASSRSSGAAAVNVPAYGILAALALLM
ncbi:similar to Saccharomyces cerevisiae YKL096W CWP1 Cell wall mannoprotein that localizes specifically to birth scars of daughter cells [Maudiozyma saulgeensis]|uniref:Similar to Saccharomyces cerevisiae YKL096W CWP1 Cell wall mannoprotein that localizes specifically to birth scars of daughter cells n=1 Tax=Maudiozyma saulgeensis TaxID=1789683 RepID=A0A1X7R483_9SACH|nr:similar to Saccharomyces cerevisiae YKL096W CWP1 Cell wall mannoprotein that localizes specifically to birth scars of daughter cells [Kazachstania saulgeensis]